MHNMRIKPSNERKNKGTTKCDENVITCDVCIAQYKERTGKCEGEKMNFQM